MPNWDQLRILLADCGWWILAAALTHIVAIVMLLALLALFIWGV